MSRQATLATISKLTDSEDAINTLSPLPPVLRNGLPAVAMFGFVSFISSLWLFFYLSYKFVVWNNASTLADKAPTSPEPSSPTTTDQNGFLVPAAYFCAPKEVEKQGPRKRSFLERLRDDPPNQFLMLIYNLLLADIQQAMAFLLNIAWLAKDSLDVDDPTCWAQGWFISTGDLASSVFISFIAVHTYLGVVKGYRLPTWIFYSAIGCSWAFTYGTAILGVIITSNGAGNGGLYVRAGAWCWVNGAYQDLRLTLHYLWIFICLAFTTIVYIAIYVHLQVHAKHSAGRCASSASSHSSDGYPTPTPGSPRSIATDMTALKQLASELPTSTRHPTFLLYPIIYVLCTAPLAAGRIASMAGNKVPLSYFCFAGTMIASAGWLDVVLYSSTRRAIVFSGEAPPSQDTGIGTFAFMRAPEERGFGNSVACTADPKGQVKKWNTWRQPAAVRGTGARLRNLAGSLGSRNGSKDAISNNSSMQSFGMADGQVMGMAIQMETTTTVTVEKTPEPSLISRKGSDASSVRSAGPRPQRPPPPVVE